MLVLGGVECAFVQADYGPLAGARFDGEDVEAARGGFDVAGAQKLAGHAREVAALFPVHCFFGGERRGPRGLRRLGRSRWLDNCARLYFDEGERLAVVADHINFAFDSWRREITGDKDVAVAAQIPVSVGFAADAGLARAMFGGITSGAVCAGRRLRRWRCAEALAGGEVNNCEHETG